MSYHQPTEGCKAFVDVGGNQSFHSTVSNLTEQEEALEKERE